MTTNLAPDVIAEIVRRLAMAFHVPLNGHGDALALDDVGLFLGGLDASNGDGYDNEVGFLIKMGVLKAAGGRVARTELLRFLDEHGEAWMLGRLDAMRTQLRSPDADASTDDADASTDEQD